VLFLDLGEAFLLVSGSSAPPRRKSRRAFSTMRLRAGAQVDVVLVGAHRLVLVEQRLVLAQLVQNSVTFGWFSL
jgi:hypothetical protein